VCLSVSFGLQLPPRHSLRVCEPARLLLRRLAKNQHRRDRR
jgi:hypothetical protein